MRCALLLLLVACNSDAENVCEDIGDCTQGGSSDWIAACKSEASKLRAEAVAASCIVELDAFEKCESDHFDCEGATSLFPGCDTETAALDSCLAAATSGTACADLAAANVACGVEAGVLVGCTALRDCEARCFLDHVQNPCAPRADEIESVTACGASCP